MSVLVPIAVVRVMIAESACVAVSDPGQMPKRGMRVMAHWTSRGSLFLGIVGSTAPGCAIITRTRSLVPLDVWARPKVGLRACF